MGILRHVAGVVAGDASARPRSRTLVHPSGECDVAVRRTGSVRSAAWAARLAVGSRSNAAAPGWQSAPQEPQAPAAGGWQSAPQAPKPPSAPPPPAAPSWQSAPQQPTPPAPAAWQSAPKAPQPPNVPPPPPPSWTANLTSTAPTPGPAGFVYADVPNRVVAYIIDAIILGLIGVLVSIVLGGAFGGITTQLSGTDGGGVSVNYGAFSVVALSNLAIGAVYFIWHVERPTRHDRDAAAGPPDR